MAKTEKPAETPDFVPVEKNKIPKGRRVVDWDITIENKLSKAKIDGVLEQIKDHIKRHDFNDEFQTVGYKYQLTKSVDIVQLYNIKVYRETKLTPKKAAKETRPGAAADVGGPIKTSGPKIPPPTTSGVVQIIPRNFEEAEVES
jgi:hypothetical protein